MISRVRLICSGSQLLVSSPLPLYSLTHLLTIYHTTASIQVEGLITLAGILERSLGTYPFDAKPTLTILNKLDYFFITLMQGEHSESHTPLPGVNPDRPFVTQTQKVRIRSIAETTRSNLFAMMPMPQDDEDGTDQDDDCEEPEMPEIPPWMMQASRVYERVLMLLGDQGDPNEAGGYEFE